MSCLWVEMFFVWIWGGGGGCSIKPREPSLDPQECWVKKSHDRDVAGDSQVMTAIETSLYPNPNLGLKTNSQAVCASWSLNHVWCSLERIPNACELRQTLIFGVKMAVIASSSLFVAVYFSL